MGPEGFEPSTQRLKGACSATELRSQKIPGICCCCTYRLAGPADHREHVRHHNIPPARSLGQASSNFFLSERDQGSWVDVGHHCLFALRQATHGLVSKLACVSFSNLRPRPAAEQVE